MMRQPWGLSLLGGGTGQALTAQRITGHAKLPLQTGCTAHRRLNSPSSILALRSTHNVLLPCRRSRRPRPRTAPYPGRIAHPASQPGQNFQRRQRQACRRRCTRPPPRGELRGVHRQVRSSPGPQFAFQSLPRHTLDRLSMPIAPQSPTLPTTTHGPVLVNC